MKLFTILQRSSKGDNSDHPTFNDLFDRFGAKKAPKDADFREKLEQHAKGGAQRLLDVFNANVVPLVPDYVAPIHLKSDEEYTFIEEKLTGAFLFENLKKHERKDLIMAFEKFEVPQAEIIVQEGAKVEYFYVIQSGTVVQDGEEEVGAGDSFGELALLYDYPSDVTYAAASDCVLWRLNQATFRKAMAAYTHRGDKEMLKFLKKVTIFKELDDGILYKIACSLRVETYEKGDNIIHKGDECKSFYIVKEGKVRATDIILGNSEYDDLTMVVGDAFGEAAIARNEPVVANVVALDHVTMLSLSREVFLKLFGDMTDLITRSLDMKMLMAIPVANKPKLESYEVELLATLVKNVTFPKGHVFFREGHTADQSLFLIRSGKVSVRSSLLGAGIEAVVGLFGYQTVGEQTFISDNGYFGADTIKTPYSGKPGPAQYTITVEEECTVGVLSMDDIWSIVQSISVGERIPFDELKMYRILGAGTFGKVWLVSQKGTNDAYALKVQGKRKTIEYGQVEGVIREKNAMARLSHPFIINLVSSYKDETSLYMLTKLYQGGELRSILNAGRRRRRGVPEQVAVFYAANMLQGMSYMHARKVLHRDLKPENVLLDSRGYAVLVDLGFARVVMNKTYTFCGTPVYIAPEIIRQKGYNQSVDIWSWAVMIYEMILGISPFYENGISQMTLFRRIVDADYVFPRGEDFMSGESKNLLRKLLVPDPKERLGCFAGGYDDIRKHLWFQSVDFEAIESREATAPWVPQLKDPLDVTNFDNWDHLKEEDDESAPLTHREQRLFDEF